MSSKTYSKQPPTDDPNLPSFLEQEYLDVADDLELVLDCWNSLKKRLGLYLAQEEYEPTRAYTNRLGRTRFDNRFKPTITGHAGLLSDFQLTDDAPATLTKAAENIDLQGNDIVTFWQQLDELVLRDGGVGILVDYPTEDDSIESNGDLLKSGRRPYLIAVDRRNILNWNVDIIAGVPTIKRVTIREFRKVRDGLFGSKLETRYRVLEPGAYYVYTMEEGDSGWIKTLVEEGETALPDSVPLTWYTITGGELFSGKPAFLNLAGLNIEHLQKRSSLNEVLWKCNMPVPVRRGLVKSAADILKGLIPKLVIGPNSVIDVPTDGDFHFAEPRGTAIEATQTDILKLEGAMDRESLAFLSGGDAEKTATEIIVDSAQTSCSLKGMARRKESAFQQVATCWGLYTKEKPPTAGAGIKVADNVLIAPATAQDAQLILDSMGVKISNNLGLKMLLERKWLPPDTDLKAELRLTEQLADEQAELMNEQQIQKEAAQSKPKPPTGNVAQQQAQTARDRAGAPNG